MEEIVVKRKRLSPAERQKRDRERYQNLLNRSRNKLAALQDEIDAATGEQNRIKKERIEIQRVFEALGGGVEEAQSDLEEDEENNRAQVSREGSL